jgi:hypothetical protein
VKKFFKWLGIIFVGIIVLSIAFGGDEEAQPTSTGKITDEKPVETTTTTEEPAAKEEPKEEEKEEPAPPPEKEPTLLFQNEQVIISFKELNEQGVKFLVENKTDKTLTIQADSIAVNGFSASDIIMSEDIAPKSKGYATAITSDLVDAGDPTKVSGQLRVIDMASANWDTVNASFTDIAIK